MPRKSQKRGGIDNDGIYEQLSLFDLLSTDVEKSITRTIEREEHPALRSVEGQRKVEHQDGRIGNGSDTSSQWRTERYHDGESDRETTVFRGSERQTSTSRDGEGNNDGLVTEATSYATKPLAGILLNENSDKINEAKNVEQTSFAFSFTQEEIDKFLIYACDNTDSGRIIVYNDFSKQKSLNEIIQTLKSVYHGGFGITTERKIAAWFADEGMFLADGKSAEDNPQAYLVQWAEMSKRIGTLIEDGKFVTKIELLNAQSFERNKIAERITFLIRDISDHVDENTLIPTLNQLNIGLHPETINNITSALYDKEFRNVIHQELENLNLAYKNHRDLLRFHYHNIPQLIKAVSELNLERKTYSSSIFTHESIQLFITDDEINTDLKRGSGFEGGKDRIYAYFQEEHSSQEASTFLKNEFGIGGRSHALSDATSSGRNYDAKGIVYNKKYCEDVKLKWTEVAQRYISLVKKQHTYNAIENDTTLENNEGNIAFLDNESNEKNEKDKQTYQYEVGQRVYLEDSLFEINEIKSDEIQLRDLSLPYYPIFRVEKTAYFEQLLSLDIRNDWLLSNKEQSSQEGNVAFLDEAEKQDEKMLGNEESPEAESLPTYTDLIAESRIPLDPSMDTRLSVHEKITRNICAIELLQKLEFNGKNANTEEKKILLRFSGWGGCPQLFNESDNTYLRERTKLKELLSINEYQNARSSTLTSFYTPIEIIQYMYDIIQKLGFENGKILDTSTGTGHFIGAMPDEIFENSEIYGIELDTISSKIARQLYSTANILNIGFAKCPYPNNQFDLAISNIPFGNYQVFDKEFSDYRFNIHNYFFAKALKKVRTGGLIAFITTSETMDGNSGIMNYINEHADFLGAVRLPNNTFVKNGANTEVTSDIIFLRRNDDKEIDVNANFTQHRMYTEHRRINQYYYDNPQMVFGEIVERTNQFGNYELTVRPDEKSLDEHFSKVMDTFESIYIPQGDSIEKNSIYKPIDIEHSQYPIDSFFIENDILYFRDEDDYYEVRIEDELKDYSLKENHIMYKTEKDIAKAKQLVLLANSAVKVVESQTRDIDENIYLDARNELNTLYDNFVNEYGALHKRNNLMLISNDPRAYLLDSLEDYNAKTKEIVKSPIFTERTIRIKKEIKSVENIHDSLMCSLDVKGQIDVDFIATLYGKSSEETRKELIEQEFVFVEPKTDKLILADDYLSGNVRKKLKLAKAYGFERNVQALEKVMPETIKAEDITIQLGASWVPNEYVKDFFFEVFEINLYQQRFTKIEYDKNLGTWVMDTPYASDVVKNVWGVAKSAGLKNKRQPDFTGYDVFDSVVNSKSPIIYNYWEERDSYSDELVTKKEVNAERTAQAHDLMDRLNERWEDWVYEDLNRRDHLVTLYNEYFNSVRLQNYDGSYLTFPQMNTSFNLEPYQKNAVARIMNQNNNTLLWQKVGAGKTFEMIAAGMEMKRLGIRNKIIYVVPNHLLNQWENEFLKLYPNAHLLVATKHDFAKQRRQVFVNKIATGNYDAIIMPHSSFGMISVGKEKQIQFETDELNLLKSALEQANSTDFEQRSTKRVKLLEKSIKNIEANIQKLTDGLRDDNAIPFEKLGIDYMFVDESHEFKNLYTYTSMKNVVGLQSARSKKAQDMYMKTRIIQENGGRICFATGTPVTNTMAELYTIQRYLQLDELHEQNIYCFDAWAKTFGKVVSSFEISIDGSQFVNRNRFAKFFNVQELMTGLRQVAEIQTSNMLREELLKSTTRRELSIPPTHIGGKPQIILIPPSEALEEYISHIVERSEMVHQHQVEPTEDNMLKITTDSKKASIDLRLINPNYPDDENGKLSVIARKVYDVYLEGMENKATQLIFCDSSTPKNNVPEGQFSDVYNEIKRKLILLGIPQEQIAFIHDYDSELKKEKLFAQMNSGEMRVLFGSTAKLGAGTNVQKRLLAVHHVDVPWKASDIEQQNGRAFRQGNMFKEIYEFRYVTEKSFDAYSWQIVQTKSTYDEQLLEGADGIREFEENQKSSFEYAEIKAIASGNPIIKEKFEIDNEVRRLERLKKQWRKTKMYAQENLVKLPTYIAEKEKLVNLLQKENLFFKNKIYDEHELDTKFRFINSDGKMFTSMKEAWDDVTQQMKQMLSFDKKVVGQFLDCSVIINKKAIPQVEFQTPQRTINIDDFNMIGRVNFARILKRIALISVNLNSNILDLENSRKNLKTAQETVDLPFVHENELQKVRTRQKEINKILNVDSNQVEVVDEINIEKQIDDDYEIDI